MTRDASETALAFYNNTYESDHKQYLSILAQTPDFDETRTEYFKLFEWTPNVLESLRSLTSKLFFKAESQHIDTILQSFAESWYERFKSKTGLQLFGNSNGVYLVSYSLILLNTDLHTQDVSLPINSTLRKHISQLEYVKNTMAALASNNIKFEDPSKIEAELRNYYDQLSHNELKLLGSPSIAFTRPKRSLDDGASVYSNNSYNGGGSPLTSPVVKSFGFASLLLNERAINQTSSLKKQYSRESLGSNFTSSQLTVYTMKTGMTTSQLSNLNEMENESELDSHRNVLLQLQQDSLSNFILEEEGDLELELDGPPWIKEGLINVVVVDNEQEPASLKTGSKFNFLKNSSSKQASSLLTQQLQLSMNLNYLSKWRNLFIVVAKGEMRVFSFESTSTSAFSSFGGSQEASSGPPNGRSKSKRSMFFSRNSSHGINNVSNANGINNATLKHTPSFASSSEPVGAGNWYDNANCIATFQLSQTYASTPTSQALHAVRTQVKSVPSKVMGDLYWSLTLPLQHSSSKKHTKLIFQCGSEDVAKEFIESCNFWAARTSNIPSETATVSSFEYGMSNRMVKLIDSLLNASNPSEKLVYIKELNSIKIVDWSPLLTSNLPTNLVMADQLTKLQNYNKLLKQQLDEHNAIKAKLDLLVKLQRQSKLTSHLSPPQHQTSTFSFRRRPTQPTTQQQLEALSQDLTIHVRMITNNYNKKLNYLNREVLKHRKYLNSLTNLIVLRRQKLKDEQEGNLNGISGNSNSENETLSIESGAGAKTKKETGKTEKFVGLEKKSAGLLNFRAGFSDDEDEDGGEGDGGEFGNYTNKIIKVGVLGVE